VQRAFDDGCNVIAWHPIAGEMELLAGELWNRRNTMICGYDDGHAGESSGNGSGQLVEQIREEPVRSDGQVLDLRAERPLGVSRIVLGPQIHRQQIRHVILTKALPADRPLDRTKNEFLSVTAFSPSAIAVGAIRTRRVRELDATALKRSPNPVQ